MKIILFRIWMIGVLIACLGLITTWVQAETTQPPDPEFQPGECPPEIGAAQNVTCGDLVVPEDRTAANSPMIRLKVMIFKAVHPDVQSVPVLYLEGGPGGSVGMFASEAGNSILRQNQDLILLEQRGNQLSTPSLDCPEYDTVILQNLKRNASEEIESSLEKEAIRACRKRLEEDGVDLSAYTSLSSAEDVADLRRALGIETWNIYGVSYGTRLALTVLRDHPEGIQAVLLDSVYPPQIDDEAELAPSMYRLLRKIFDGCSADPACNAAYPHLEKEFTAFIEQSNLTPVQLQTTDPLTGKTITLKLTGPGILRMIFTAGYSTELSPYLPFLLHEISNGENSVLLPLADFTMMYMDAVNKGVYLSVQCYDEYFFNTPEVIAQAAQAVPEPFQKILTIPTTYCNSWRMKVTDPVEDLPVESELPVLIFSGDQDPITTTEQALDTAKTLPSAQVLVFPGYGHAVFFSSACAQNLAVEFFANPLQKLDISCVPQASEQNFSVMKLWITGAFYQMQTQWLNRGKTFPVILLLLGNALLLIEVLYGILFRWTTGRRWMGTGASRSALWISWGTAILGLGFSVGMVIGAIQSLRQGAMILAFGIPAMYQMLLLLPILGLIGCAFMLVSCFRGWIRHWWNPLWRVQYTIILFACIGIHLFGILWFF